jgi:hypothetical protein
MTRKADANPGGALFSIMMDAMLATLSVYMSSILSVLSEAYSGSLCEL